MSFVLDLSQNTLSNLLAQAALDQNINPQAAYTPVYDYIYSAISTTDINGHDIAESGVDKSVWEWVKGARQVNADDGSYFSDFIRDYTSTQYELRYGQTLSDLDIQNASNKIIDAFAKDIISSEGILPSLLQTGQFDAGSIAANIFNNSLFNSTLPNHDYSPWAGTILFAYLDTDLHKEKFTAISLLP